MCCGVRLLSVEPEYWGSIVLSCGFGTSMIRPHFLHFPLLPAWCSSAEYDAPQFEQLKWIFMWYFVNAKVERRRSLPSVSNRLLAGLSRYFRWHGSRKMVGIGLVFFSIIIFLIWFKFATFLVPPNIFISECKPVTLIENVETKDYNSFIDNQGENWFIVDYLAV